MILRTKVPGHGSCYMCGESVASVVSFLRLTED